MLKKTIAVLVYSTGELKLVNITLDSEDEEIEDKLFSKEDKLNETNCSWIECDINQIQQELIKLTKEGTQ